MALLNICRIIMVFIKSIYYGIYQNTFLSLVLVYLFKRKKRRILDIVKILTAQPFKF